MLLSIYLDMTGLIIEVIWPEYDELINTKSNLLPLKIFLKEVLKRSRTSYSTLQTALFYLFRIRPKIEGLKNQLLTSIPTESLRKSVMMISCCRRMFLTSLIIATKYLQDRSYSNKAWSKITGLTVKEINYYEIFFWQLIDYNLYVAGDSFKNWCTFLLNNIKSISGKEFIIKDNSFRRLKNEDKINSFKKILI